MMEARKQEVLETGESHFDIEALHKKLAEIELREARINSKIIYDATRALKDKYPDFDIFFEEICFEGLKLVDPDFIANTHLSEKGYIIADTADAMCGNYPSNIDVINTPAIKLSALKYFTEIPQKDRPYIFGNISAFAERLKNDMHDIIDEQRANEKASAEKSRAEKIKFEQSIEEHRAIIHREVPNVFEKCGLPLNSKLTQMLMEPDEQQRGRTGSGYTNVFRELSTYVNNTLRNPLDLFDESALDIDSIYEKNGGKRLSREELIEELGVKEKLAKATSMLPHPSHQIITGMMHDILFGSEKDVPELKIKTNLDESKKVGTCTTAELYYFKWDGIKGLKDFKDGYTGHMKIITDDKGNPLLIEKVGMGEKTSCLSLVPLKMGKVLIPAGSMVQSIPKEGMESEKTGNEYFKEKTTLDNYEGFKFLRLSTLALPSNIREESFGNHYYQQMTSDYVNYDWLEMHHYQELVENVLENK